jgi:hypothetical protein
MSDCTRLSDRIPDVVAGTAAWTRADEDHLATCADCAGELELVRSTAALGDAFVSRTEPALAASGITRRLADARRAERRDRRAAWVAVAAAAAVVLVISSAGRGPAARVEGPPVAAAADPAAAGESALVPELDSLDAGELSAVLDAFDAPHAEADPPPPRSLGDLTDQELERVLRGGGA